MVDYRAIYRHILEEQIMPVLLSRSPIFWPGFSNLRLDTSPYAGPRKLEQHDVIEIVHITSGRARVYF